MQLSMLPQQRPVLVNFYHFSWLQQMQTRITSSLIHLAVCSSMILCWEIVRGYGLNIPPKVAPATHHLVQDTWTATEKSGHCHGQRCELPQQKVDTATTKSGYCHCQRCQFPQQKVDTATTKSGYCHGQRRQLPQQKVDAATTKSKYCHGQRCQLPLQNKVDTATAKSRYIL